ncbi:MAG: chemotaxis protein CheW [Desulfobacterales bacterium]
MQQLVLFQTGNMHFALDRNCVRDIRPIPARLTPAQGRTPHHTIEIEGRLLLLIDLAAASSQDTTPAHPSKGKIIVLTGSPPLALLADNVHGAIDAGADQMDDLPSVFAGTARACFPKVLRLEEQVALVLDAAALAEFEACAAASATDRPTRQKPAAQNPEASLAASGVRLKAPSQRIDTRAIEAIIAEKLQTIISLRVQEAVVQALRRHVRHTE